MHYKFFGILGLILAVLGTPAIAEDVTVTVAPTVEVEAESAASAKEEGELDIEDPFSVTFDDKSLSGPAICSDVSSPPEISATDSYIKVLILLPSKGLGGAASGTYKLEVHHAADQARIDKNRWVRGVQDCVYGDDGQKAVHVTWYRIGARLQGRYYVTPMYLPVSAFEENIVVRTRLDKVSGAPRFVGEWKDREREDKPYRLFLARVEEDGEGD